MRILPLFALACSISFCQAQSQSVEILDSILLQSSIQIVDTLGEPDRVDYLDEKDATVWTYFSEEQNTSGNKSAADTSSYSSSAKFSMLPFPHEVGFGGYTQVAFWNDRVAGFSVVESDDTARANYDSRLSFLEDNSGTIVRSVSENLRMTRRGDGLWIIDYFDEGASDATVLRIVDAEFGRCSKTNPTELRRIKEQYGKDL